MNIRQFIQSFLARKGLMVLSATIFAKVVNFLVLILVINWLPPTVYGRIAYSLTIIGFIAPFVGGGIHQGLLRYGALSKSQSSKKSLFQATFKLGLRYTGIIVLVLLLLSPWLTLRMPGALPFLLLLSLQILAIFILQMIQVYCRLLHRNQLFARIDIQHNVLLLLSCIVLVLGIGGFGYVLSLILVPLLLGVYYLRRLNLFSFRTKRRQTVKNENTFSKKELVKYGLYMSIGGVVSQLLYAVDVLLIGNLMEDAAVEVAIYKVASIFPYSILMLSVAMMTTDFVKLAKDAVHQKNILWNYYKNYLKLFGAISLALLVFFYFAAPLLLRLFGATYQGHETLVYIFSIGVVGGILLRIPLGNMLSAIGWPRLNALFAAIILAINLVANYFMILRFGIIGAAITTASLMWLSGIFSLVAFLVFLKR